MFNITRSDLLNHANREAMLSLFGQPVQRDADPLTFSATAARLYGPSLLFDLCADDNIVALSVFGTYPKLLDWIGWENTNEYIKKQYFLTYADAAGTQAGSRTTGYVTNPCAPGNTAEWGTCDFTLTDFGRYRRSSPVRDLTKKALRYCKTQPKYRLDGQVINSDIEWDMVTVTQALINDLSAAVITGNATTAGQFDGLKRLVKYGYTNASTAACPAMDSIVIDWDSGELCQAAAVTGVDITVNGAAVTTFLNFIDMLRWAVRRVLYRVRNSQYGSLRDGDMAIVMPYEFINCLLDCYVCYTKCGGDITRIDSFEARNFRAQLNGGLFGDGQLLNLDGVTIPIIAHDFGLIDSSTQFDMFVLVRALGGQPVLRMETLDMNEVVTGEPGYEVVDNKWLMWVNRDNTCRQTEMEIQPRMRLTAPWAQIAFQNVVCTGIPNVLSMVPGSTQFASQFGYGDLRQGT